MAVAGTQVGFRNAGGWEASNLETRRVLARPLPHFVITQHHPQVCWTAQNAVNRLRCLAFTPTCHTWLPTSANPSPMSISTPARHLTIASLCHRAVLRHARRVHGLSPWPATLPLASFRNLSLRLPYVAIPNTSVRFLQYLRRPCSVTNVSAICFFILTPLDKLTRTV